MLEWSYKENRPQSTFNVLTLCKLILQLQCRELSECRLTGQAAFFDNTTAIIKPDSVFERQSGVEAMSFINTVNHSFLETCVLNTTKFPVSILKST